MLMTKSVRKHLIESGASPTACDATLMDFAAKEILAGRLTADRMKQLDAADRNAGVAGSIATPEMIFGTAGKSGRRSYSTTKRAGRHAKTGEHVRNEFGRETMRPSEFELAQAGAVFKQLAARAGLPVTLDDHEREVLDSTADQLWCGKHGGEFNDRISGTQGKALLDDALSGGIEAVPIVVDDALISFPLLTGELLPQVDLRPVPRGRRVEGASVGNPTLSWGTIEGTAIDLFDTNSLVSAIDTTIHEITAAVEVGRDFLQDSIGNVGMQLVANIGQRLGAELDRVIAIGNGTNEPQGVMNASGTTSVAFSSTTATVAGYESLLFTPGKQYRTAGMRPVFCSNETSYQRARGIAVSGTDQRRVFGMSHEDYSLLGRPHKIASDMTNLQIFFGAMAKYRLYRRQGLSIEWHTQGENLARKNTALLIARARFGGRVVDANAFGVVTDALA